MYNNSSSENDEFNRMQQKIKDTIESIVPDNHICNPSDNSLNDNTNANNTDNKYS